LVKVDATTGWSKLMLHLVVQLCWSKLMLGGASPLIKVDATLGAEISLVKFEATIGWSKLMLYLVVRVHWSKLMLHLVLRFRGASLLVKVDATLGCSKLMLKMDRGHFVGQS